MIELNEEGTYTACEGGFELRDVELSTRRVLREKEGGYWVVVEQELKDCPKKRHALFNCHLEVSKEISE